MTPPRAAKNPPEDFPAPAEPGLTTHLYELRNRLSVVLIAMVLAGIVAFVFKEQVFAFLTWPLRAANPDIKLIFTGVPELFFTYLKLSLWCGFFVAFPLMLWQLWRFVAPGLYAHEKKFVAPLLAIGPLLFYAGGALALLVVMPLAVAFFLEFAGPNIEAWPAVKEYLSFTLKLCFAFGIAFELPIVVLLLVASGLCSRAKLAGLRRYIIVGVFVFAAVLTPPDPVSQLLLALPMIVLFEAGLFAARFFRAPSPAND